MTPKETAQRFWSNVNTYPVQWQILPHRVDADIVNYYMDSNNLTSILDIGAGPGCIYPWLSNSKVIHAVDINQDLLASIQPGPHSVVTYLRNICTNTLSDIETCDMALIIGVLNFVIDNKELEFVLNNIEEDHLLVRVACQENDLTINKFVENLGTEYAARYRPVSTYTDILNTMYKQVIVAQPWALFEIDKVLPHRQYHLLCRGRK